MLCSPFAVFFFKGETFSQLSFLPTSPNSESSFDSIIFLYFFCLFFNAKDLIQCKVFGTGFQKCVLKHRYDIWGCKVEVCKSFWTSVEDLNRSAWVEMLAVFSILLSVNGTGKLHFPRSLPDIPGSIGFYQHIFFSLEIRILYK